MNIISRAERQFLRRHLSTVRHVTLDPDGPGVLRLHLLPRRHSLSAVPYVAILNGRDILPLSVSWAILLTCLIEALQPLEGQIIDDSQWAERKAAAVRETQTVYSHVSAVQIAADLDAMLQSFHAMARGEAPLAAVQPIRLGDYAPHMTAPHRMDLLVSSMVKDGAWHCNQKCLHCYAANQPLAEASELDTDQWLAVLQKCRTAGISQVTFTGGEPTLRHDLVQLVRAAQWFVTRLNTNGRMLTSALCRELREASLDAVQITLYSADADTHNALVGAPGFADTVAGIRNAVEAGLNVSINTPLCSLNRDYRATLELAHSLGVRYVTCSGLIPAGCARTEPSLATRLSAEDLTDLLRDAMSFVRAHEMEISFTSPGWLPEKTLLDLGFTEVPSCGACLSNMAIAPDGTMLPCQSWLSGKGLGNLLHTPWHRIWDHPACRRIRAQSARMEQRCPLSTLPEQEVRV